MELRGSLTVVKSANGKSVILKSTGYDALGVFEKLALQHVKVEQKFPRSSRCFPVHHTPPTHAPEAALQLCKSSLLPETLFS